MVMKSIVTTVHRWFCGLKVVTTATNAPTGRVDRNWTKSGGKAP